jgi:uncharacterized NAD(P)/FAD-binding protein YdhS
VKTNKTIAVVGGGAVGTSLCHHLVEEFSHFPSAGSVQILLFEKATEVGPGVAYQPDEAPFLLNRSVEGMSAIHDRPDDFLDWALRMGKVSKPLPEGGAFLSRAVFGEYLKSVHSETRRQAMENGTSFEVARKEVTGIEDSDGGRHRLSLDDGSTQVVDVVILAPGNLPSRRFRNLANKAGYLPSPYPSTRIRTEIDPNRSVAVLGTRLSAVDAVLALDHLGHQGTIYMVSREGRIPSIRSGSEARKMNFLTRERILSLSNFGKRKVRLDEVLYWISKELGLADPCARWSWDEKRNPVSFLRRDLNEAGAGVRSWQSVGVALNEVIELLWSVLDEADQKEFKAHYYSIWMSYRVPIPEQSGKRLLQLMESGRVQVLAGLSDVKWDPLAESFEIDLGRTGTLRCGSVINATGSPTSLGDCDSRLMDSLLASHWLSAHPMGGIDVDFDSSAVRDRNGTPRSNAYVVGNLTSGVHLFTSVLELNVKRAAGVAQQVAMNLFIKTNGDESYESPIALPAQSRAFAHSRGLGIARSKSVGSLYVGSRS